MTGSYKDLRVWRDSLALAADVYRITKGFPKHELYGLSSQMQRAAISVPSNIAEGKGHRSNAEFTRFLYHARGSLLELETQIFLAGQLQYLSDEQLQPMLEKTGNIARSLNALLHSLEVKSAAQSSGMS